VVAAALGVGGLVTPSGPSETAVLNCEYRSISRLRLRTVTVDENLAGLV